MDEVMECNQDFVKFKTKEFPGYLFKNSTSVDTLSFVMTYYFEKGLNYKVRTDTLLNTDYCYKCGDRSSRNYLDSFFDWMEKVYPSKSEQLGEYYDALYRDEVDRETTIEMEQLQKKLFLEWESINRP